MQVSFHHTGKTVGKGVGRKVHVQWSNQVLSDEDFRAREIGEQIQKDWPDRRPPTRHCQGKKHQLSGTLNKNKIKEKDI